MFLFFLHLPQPWFKVRLGSASGAHLCAVSPSLAMREPSLVGNPRGDRVVRDVFFPAKSGLLVPVFFLEPFPQRFLPTSALPLLLCDDDNFSPYGAFACRYRSLLFPFLSFFKLGRAASRRLVGLMPFVLQFLGCRGFSPPQGVSFPAFHPAGLVAQMRKCSCSDFSLREFFFPYLGIFFFLRFPWEEQFSCGTWSLGAFLGQYLHGPFPPLCFLPFPLDPLQSGDTPQRRAAYLRVC